MLATRLVFSRPPTVTAWLLLALSFAATAQAQPAHAASTKSDLSAAPEMTEIRWQPYTGEALDGSPMEGELGYLPVPENRQRPTAKKIDLAFVRFRTSHPQPGPPIFFLAGGPGGSGIEGAAVVASHPQIRLLEHSDVIGIDQRGTGLSLPDLTQTVAEIQLPLEQPLTRAQLVSAVQQVVVRTMSHWRRHGVDLEAYNTRASADDIEAVRQALGLDEIVLYGASYGSHLGLAYLRWYDAFVARAVLSKVEGPNHTFKLPSTVQDHLESLDEFTANGTERFNSSSLVTRVRQLLQQLEEHPTGSYERSDGEEPIRVTLSPLDLQIALSRALSTSKTIAEIPAHLERFESGDWSQLAKEAFDHRRVEVRAMVLMMDCSSGATAGRWQALAEQTIEPTNLLADGILAPYYPAACQAAGWPDLGDAFRAPIHTSVPVLFTSGSLDVRTPPGNVEQLLDGFVNGTHVVAIHAGHESRELMSSEYRRLLQSFLRGDQITDCAILLPQPIFASEAEL